MNQEQIEQNAVGRWQMEEGVRAIRSLVNARICNLSVLVLHKTLLVPVLMYGSETDMEGEGEI